MAKISYTGIDVYSEVLSGISRELDGILKQGVYDGAAVAADAIRENIESLPEIHGMAPAGGFTHGGVTKPQKEGLLNGLGIAKIKSDGGSVNTKIGFNGYNSTKTRKWPGGQPNTLIARAAESGVSWKPKTPFVRPAIKRVKDKVIKEMASTVEAEISKRSK